MGYTFILLKYSRISTHIDPEIYFDLLLEVFSELLSA